MSFSDQKKVILSGRKIGPPSSHQRQLGQLQPGCRRVVVVEGLREEAGEDQGVMGNLLVGLVWPVGGWRGPTTVNRGGGGSGEFR